MQGGRGRVITFTKCASHYREGAPSPQPNIVEFVRTQPGQDPTAPHDM